jgi:type II secretory pathway pseudopilin PulG
MLELLVVIVIVLILTAIMLPVLMRAKTYATAGNCTSNMRQIYLAIKMYEKEHDVLPPTLASLPRADELVRCRRGDFPTYRELWRSPDWAELARENPGSVILVADGASSRHSGRNVGLYRNGRIRVSRKEGNPHMPQYWH